MKDARRKLLAVTVSALAPLAAGCGHVSIAASAPAAPAAENRPAPPARQDEKVFVTGSRIPQRVDTSRGLPATASPVRIYSRGDLARTGRPETGDAFRQLDPSIP